MQNTRSKILNTARILFNNTGYWNVTIRMIAAELGISSGNLNYHFKKKEEILEALYFEMSDQFDQRIENLKNVKFTFDQIHQDIRSSMSIMIEYKFIWTDLYRIMQENEKLFNHFSSVHTNRINGYLYLYQQLISSKLMKDEFEQNDYKLLASKMVNFGDTWIYSSLVYRDGISKTLIEQKSYELIMMLLPYLTEKGRFELNQVKALKTSRR